MKTPASELFAIKLSAVFQKDGAAGVVDPKRQSAAFKAWESRRRAAEEKAKAAMEAAKAPAPPPSPAEAPAAPPDAIRTDLISPAEDYKKNGVKSKAFKSWFGDWEKPSAEVSKVVDADGKPKETYEVEQSKVMKDGIPVVVYHGTAHGGFHVFDRKKLKDPEGLLHGPGFYFTESLDIAKQYRRKDAEMKLQDEAGNPVSEEKASTELRKRIQARLRKPQVGENEHQKTARLRASAYLRDHRADVGWDSLARHFLGEGREASFRLRQLDTLGIKSDDLINPVGERVEVKAVYLNIRKPFDVERDKVPKERLPKDVQERAWRREYDYDSLKSLMGSKKAANDVLEKSGYDGITHVGGKVMGDRPHRVWIAFQPHQIKAVENDGVFDAANPDIRKTLRDMFDAAASREGE